MLETEAKSNENQSSSTEEVEIWKTHSSGYEVSSLGRVKGKLVEFLKPHINGDGYPAVGICVDNVAKGKCMHRLVAETFLGDIPYGMVVNHKDGNKLNPNLSNLEIISCKQNSIHAYKMGLYPLLRENKSTNTPKNPSQSIPKVKPYQIGKSIVNIIFTKRKKGESVANISKEVNLPENKIYRMLQFGYEKNQFVLQIKQVGIKN
jgi:hypothetical protein